MTGSARRSRNGSSDWPCVLCFISPSLSDVAVQKEEKAHDERIVAANARIKQAGQAYEKSVKKNAQYAGEEHARYMQLITALGPEVSQEN